MNGFYIIICLFLLLQVRASKITNNNVTGLPNQASAVAIHSQVSRTQHSGVNHQR